MNDERIAQATTSLREMLGDIAGLRFVDVGSGSGLFSLAAHRLGARVHSFDYDPQSVACSREVRRRYGDESTWTVEEGSVLDTEYLGGLGKFDVVYSWGVLHHTGRMWEAFENVAALVAPNGKLYIAIYNDQGWLSAYWTGVKRLYNRSSIARLGLNLIHMPIFFGGSVVYRALTPWPRPKRARGMSRWYDYFDWMGGYPFEVASCEQVCNFFAARGFDVIKLKDVSPRNGCNEFLFARTGP